MLANNAEDLNGYKSSIHRTFVFYMEPSFLWGSVQNFNDRDVLKKERRRRKKKHLWKESHPFGPSQPRCPNIFMNLLNVIKQWCENLILPPSVPLINFMQNFSHLKSQIVHGFNASFGYSHIQAIWRTFFI